MKTHPVKHLKDYRAPEFLVDHINLTFDLHETATRVTSLMTIRRNPKVADENTSLVFDMKNMEIESVVADGMVLLPGEYQVTGNTFRLYRTPGAFTLEIVSNINPRANTILEGLYMSSDFFCTQCEAEGFRNITPFPDRPDVMSSYTCTLIADQDRYPVLLSNGNPVKKGILDHGRHFAVWEDPFKKPCYLFALVAGDLDCLKDQFTTCSGRIIDLHIYSDRQNISRCRHAMTSLKQAMTWDEEKFGREYDLDLYQIVAVNDFNAGAMENKGLNIFNSKFVLADPESATDLDFLYVQAVIAHEYFHNWTGNRITLKNWFQLSLKEGLTVFRDQEFSSDLNSRGVKRISDVKMLRLSQFAEDDSPMVHPVRPESYIEMNNFYTMTVYHKGAEIVRMVHRILGPVFFRKAMDLYFERFDGMAVTIEDFIGVMQEASGIDLARFSLWYSQSGTPVVEMIRSYDSDLNRLKIIFRQNTPPDRNQPVKAPLHIPVGFGLMMPDGTDITPDDHMLLHLKQPVEEFVFENIPPTCIPSVFRQFSAPVKIITDLTDSEMAFLMAHDTDEFNRYDAAQELFFREMKILVEAVQENRPLSVSDLLIQAFKAALADKTTDRAFTAKALLIPDESEIKNHFSPVDVEAIHQARNFLVKTIGKGLVTDFMGTIDTCSRPDPKSLCASAMADRSLKNLCLSYVGMTGDEASTQLVYQHFCRAENMTDEIAALTVLSHIESDLTRSAIDAFYSKWKHNTLVLDKWFSVQAASSLPGTLEKVIELTGHPDFSIQNPNKVRSLINMFAMFNPMHFHRPDGSGYQFIEGQVRVLDGINPQVASRVATAFNHWKKYDENRQALMKQSLEKLLAHPDLSGNVYEIAARALES